MPGRIERIATQRARRPTGADHAECPLDEPASGLGRQPDAQEVRPVLVVILDLDRLGLGLRIGVGRRLGPSLDEDPFRLAVPAKGQGAGPEGFVERLVEGLLVGIDRRRRVLDDPVPVELDQEAP
jgi:hypothetical protein